MARTSARDIDADGNSIATQRDVCVKRCARLKAPILKEFVEPGSSAQSIAKRSVFRELLSYVEEHPEVRYVVIYMRSRIFRNQTDAAITKRVLSNMGVKLISAKEEFGEGYMADAMEAITDIMNEVQVRQSGEDIRNKLLHKAKNGGTVGRAKLGYLNVRRDFEGQLVNAIDVDPVRAPLVKLSFEQYATGDYSVVQLLEFLTEQGLTSRRSMKRPERPTSRSQLSLILRDPYYLGMVTFKGQLYPGRHQPIVDTELFERVQRIIDNRMHPAQRDITHNHFLRGLMHCGHCRDAGRSHRLIYTEAVKRTDQASQIYAYYFCRGRQENDCDLPYLPTREVERAVGREFAALTLSPETLSIARTKVFAALEQELSSKAEQLKRLRKELNQVESQEERLVDLAADGLLATGKLRERLKEVQIRKNRIRDQLGSTDEELRTRTDTVLAYLDLLERPEALYVGASDTIKRQLLTAFFRRI